MNDNERKKHLISAIAETMKSQAISNERLDFDGSVMLLSLAFKPIHELERIAKLANIKGV